MTTEHQKDIPSPAAAQPWAVNRVRRRELTPREWQARTARLNALARAAQPLVNAHQLWARSWVEPAQHVSRAEAAPEPWCLSWAELELERAFMTIPMFMKERA